MNFGNQAGFSLVELISVVIIVGILSVTASVRFSSSDIHLQSAKSDVLAALIFARELAMARSDGTSSVQFIATASTVDVQLNNNSISSSYQRYPLTLPSDVAISTGVGLLSFNRLGETSAHSFILTQGNNVDSITVSGVGYAY